MSLYFKIMLQKENISKQRNYRKDHKRDKICVKTVSLYLYNLLI